MSQVVQKNTPVAVTIFLRDAASHNGATGLVFSSVTASYRQPSASAFTPKSLNSSNFLEIGNGFYSIAFVGETNATAAIGSGIDRKSTRLNSSHRL